VGGGESKQRICKYGQCALYSYIKIEQRNLLKLFKEGEGGRGRTMEGVNPTKIYYKCICKDHIVFYTTIMC
jgi:hypothetical protein